jgi:hypothetical protein
MNTLSDFIDGLEAEPYYFVGSYWTSDVLAPHPMPFEFDCEFTHNDSGVFVEGLYRAHSGAPQHPFQLRLPFKGVTPHAVSSELESPAIGLAVGSLMFVSGAATFLGRSKQAILSAHVTVEERGIITLVGTLELQGKQYGYKLKGAVASYRATLANVVGIRAPKR